ncbi:hypothetical protein CPG37_09480 [Malaciobacter canalis]|uniref:Uncharacterized protein n=1 Tax=Malaciobacter canalis TaxID=1912871 RepID=A0ABX4LP25_9BACT|nr:hypothetical protein [Malaciobacter canalis]PHO09498.1 hypothetical protein CPG37_09480 [Malaciobacter canalis]QEE33625.1 hypothetical protein ACAN_2174 [Malaciobacter canalis]
MKKKYLILLFTILLLLLAILYISKQNKNSLIYSFYHWENSYNIKENKEKLYIKVLDIDYSNKLEIIKTRFDVKPPKNFIPVIYITNKTMKTVKANKLASKVLKALDSYRFTYDELQIDCDWSLNSKANYFKFLKLLKTNLNKKLSATIRLHQIKYYKKTGVPSVDYGLLMYYNMSYIGDYNTKNSILDNNIAKKYQYNFDKYPLKLKLALPLYSQAVQFRYKKPLDIFEGIVQTDFDEKFEKLKNGYFKVLQSHYFKGRYVYEDDIFRFEDSKKQDLKIALEDFFKISNNRFDEVVFYTIKYKNKYDLQKLLKGI